MEIAAILESKGAICTKEEIGRLGNKYTNFISFITNRRESALGVAQSLQQRQSKQENEEMEAFRQQIEKLNHEIREKDRIIEEKEARIQQKDKKIQREEKMQMQLWKFKQKQVAKISNFKDLQLISKIAHGCDAVVFNCSALHLGIPSVALKILFNLGIDTSQVPTSFANEFAILKQLPFYPNIIPIWQEFLDRPTQPFIDLFPPDLKPFVVNERMGTVRSTTCIVMPLLECFKVFFDREFKNIREIGRAHV